MGKHPGLKRWDSDLVPAALDVVGGGGGGSASRLCAGDRNP